MTNSETAALMRAKEFDAAIADYTKAIGLEPKPAAAYFNRGVVYYRKGEQRRAVTDFGGGGGSHSEHKGEAAAPL